MSNKNIVTGQLASITTYDSVTSQIEGVATETVTANTVSGNTVSLGTGNLVLSGNSISTTADTITIDPLGDGNPTGNLVVTANMQVTGTLTYNDVVNATTTDLQWIAANDAASTSLASGAGLAVGPAGAYASFTYNSAANVWQSSLPLVSNGGINANGAITGATTGTFSGVVSAGTLTVSGTSNLGSVGNVTITGGSPGKALTTNGSGVLGWTTVVDPATIPAFSAYSTASVVIPSTFAEAIVSWNVEEYDSDGWFASNRYTPQYAGWYQISCAARTYVSGAANESSISLRKNGSVIGTNGSFGQVTGTISRLVFLNGSTDYVDVVITNYLAGTVVQSSNQSYFTGFWVRP